MIEPNAHKSKRLLSIGAIGVALVLGVFSIVGVPGNMAFQKAYAHLTPSTATKSAVGITLGVFWDAAGTQPVLVLDPQTDSGKTLYLIGSMSPTGTATQDFAFEGNHTASATPSFATITTPDGVVHNETPNGGIACIGVNQVANPTVGAPYPCTNQVSSQDLNETTYTVNFADASGGFFFFFRNVVNAHLHQLATDSTTGQRSEEHT